MAEIDITHVKLADGREIASGEDAQILMFRAGGRASFVFHVGEAGGILRAVDLGDPTVGWQSAPLPPSLTAATKALLLEAAPALAEPSADEPADSVAALIGAARVPLQRVAPLAAASFAALHARFRAEKVGRMKLPTAPRVHRGRAIPEEGDLQLRVADGLWLTLYTPCDEKLACELELGPALSPDAAWRAELGRDTARWLLRNLRQVELVCCGERVIAAGLKNARLVLRASRLAVADAASASARCIMHRASLLETEDAPHVGHRCPQQSPTADSPPGHPDQLSGFLRALRATLSDMGGADESEADEPSADEPGPGEPSADDAGKR
jgi:hypothetical protein